MTDHVTLTRLSGRVIHNVPHSNSFFGFMAIIKQSLVSSTEMLCAIVLLQVQAARPSYLSPLIAVPNCIGIPTPPHAKNPAGDIYALTSGMILIFANPVSQLNIKPKQGNAASF